jgi:hypothetical protein
MNMKESNKLIMMTHEIRKYITTLNGSSSCEFTCLVVKYVCYMNHDLPLYKTTRLKYVSHACTHHKRKILKKKSLLPPIHLA